MTDTPTPMPRHIPHDDLPIWMRKAMRGNDYGAWLTLLFSLLIAWYFVVGPHLPTNTATENYTFRAATYAESIREGRLYPRWDATANNGYGAPIPHYAPPAAPYLAAMLDVFITQDTVFAVRLVYALAFMLAAGGVYGLIIRLHSAGPAMLAALLYITSPYFGLTSPHLLGDLPGTLALGLAPALLWSVHRLLTVNDPYDYALLTGTLAALILTQPQVATAAAGLALTLGGWCHTNGHRQHTRLALVAALNALALTAFYWLPALTELRAVNWLAQPTTARPLFLTWGGLFAPFTQVNPAALIPDVPLTLGIIAPLIALASTAVLVRARHFTVEAAFLTTAAALILLAVLAFPNEHWLLGIISLCLALASGPALALRQHLPPPLQRWTLILVLLIVLARATAAWLPPAPGGILTETDARARIAYQQRGYGQPTVPHGQPYPSTIPADLPANRALISDFQQRGIAYFVPDNLPNPLSVGTLYERSHTARYQVSTSTTSTFPILKAAFPGWRAWLDGLPLEITTSPNNLLQLSVPRTDRQTLTLRLGTTPPRLLGWAAASVGLIALAVIIRRQRAHTNEAYLDLQFLTLAETRLTGVVFALGLLIVFFTASPSARYSIRQQPTTTPPAAVPLNSRSTAGINLLAFRLPSQTTYRPGANIPLTLYWSALIPQTTNYYPQVTLVGPTTTYTKAQLRHPGGYPATRWLTNRYIADPHYIQLPPDLPPGTYTLRVSLAPCPTPALTGCQGTTPVFFSNTGAVIGPNHPLPQTLQVTD